MLAMIESITDGRHLRIGDVARPVVLLAGEESFVALLKYILEHADFVCYDTKNSNAVARSAEQHRPDLIALDSTLKQRQHAGYSGRCVDFGR